MDNFKYGDIIKDKDGYQKCICVDDNYAIFAKSIKSGTRAKLTKLFAVHPQYTKVGEGDWESWFETHLLQV